MSAQGLQHCDDCQARPFRSTSCQLPVQQTGAGRSINRVSPSCNIEVAEQHASDTAASNWLPTCKSEGSYADYQGGKSRTEKWSRPSYTAATLLSVLVVLVPLAFLGGYGTALLTSPWQQQTSRSIGMTGIARGSGVGRLLSHDESIGSSVEVLEADARRLASIETTALVPQHPLVAQMQALPGVNVLFVTWIAFGELGDSGFHTHNFHKVDLRWAEVAKTSHPGCKIGLVLDQDTQLEKPELVDFVHRLTIDKKVYGRNEYNDFYHWTARYSMLEKLQAEGNDRYNVVFVDPDVFVLDDIQEVFDNGGGFDYAATISENPEQPINGAMHFVRARRYGAAIDILKGVLSSFQLKPEMGFTAGQQAYSDFFELTANEALVEQLQDQSVNQGMSCRSIKEGEFNVCYVICARYNMWEDCTSNPAMKIAADRSEDLAAAHVKVMHFIAYRKLGMQQVYDAFMAEGLQGAYRAWASLPHTEDGYKADPRFGQEA